MPTDSSPRNAAAAPGQRAAPAGFRKQAIIMFSNVLLMFLCAQLLGIYAGTFIIKDAAENEIISAFNIVGEGTSPAFSAVYLFACVLIGAVVMIALIRFYKGDLLFRLLEFGVVSFSSSIVFYSFLKPLLAHTALSMGISIVLALLFALSKALSPSLKNIAAVISTAGAGAVFGFSLPFLSALLFTILLSAYDYIAVFKTRHMVEMAKSVSSRNLSFVITSKRQTEAGEISFELGTGDMLIPVVLAVSGMQLSPAYGIVVLAASTFSLIALFVMLSRKKEVLPALPIIAFFNILGILSYYVLDLVF